ncbi:MAG: hypothetical protein WBA12_08835, partial [Catalinimonas sp.]
ALDDRRLGGSLDERPAAPNGRLTVVRRGQLQSITMEAGARPFYQTYHIQDDPDADAARHESRRRWLR